MTMQPLRPPHRRQALAGLQAAVGSVAPPNPVVLAWCWRYELVLAAGLAAAVIGLARIPAAAWAAAGPAAEYAVAAAPAVSSAAVVAVAGLWPSAWRLLAPRHGA
jgi:hypothetical protein